YLGTGGRREQQVFKCGRLQEAIVAAMQHGFRFQYPISQTQSGAGEVFIDQEVITVKAHAKVEGQVAGGGYVILNVSGCFPTRAMVVEEKGFREDKLLSLRRQIGLFFKQLGQISYRKGERLGHRKTRELQARLYCVTALVPRQRAEQSVVRMM